MTLGKWKLGFFLHFHLLIISDASRFKTVNSFLHAQTCQEFGTTKWRLGQHVDETKQALFFGPTYVTQYPLMIFPQLIISYERLRVPAVTYEVLEKATWSTTRTPSLWNRPLGSQHDSMVLHRDPEDPEDPEGMGGTTHGTFETSHGASGASESHRCGQIALPLSPRSSARQLGAISQHRAEKNQSLLRRNMGLRERIMCWCRLASGRWILCRRTEWERHVGCLESRHVYTVSTLCLDIF